MWNSHDTTGYGVKVEIKHEINCPGIGSYKFEHVGFRYHMQMSVLSGLIHKFQGAGNYLNERDNPMMEVPRTIVSRVTFKEEFLDIPTLKRNIYRLPTDGTIRPTHVVVGITYGIESFCVLSHKLNADYLGDQDVSREEAKKFLSKIALKMKSGLEEQQSFAAFKGQFDKEEQQHLTRMLASRLYTDSVVEHSSILHCDVFDAYKHCHQCHKNLSSSEIVPISFSICPVSVLINQPQISDKFFNFHLLVDGLLVERCVQTGREFERIIAKVEVIRKVSDKSHRRCLLQFQEAVTAYQEIVKNSFKNGLIIGRDAGNFEDLENATSITQTHPNFKYSRLEKWIEYKQFEIDLAKKMKSINGITFLESQTRLEKELTDSFEKKYSVVLTIPALADQTDNILKAMAAYIETSKSKRGNLAHINVKKVEHMDSDERFPLPILDEGWMRKELMAKISELAHFAKMNKDCMDLVQFFIIFSKFGNKFEFSYSVYEADNLLTLQGHCIRLPCPPSGLRTKPTGSCDKSMDAVIVEWKYEPLGYPYQFVVEYRLKGSSEKSWNRRKTSKPFLTQTTISFKRGSTMEIRVAADTCIGLSEFSGIIETDPVSS